MLPSTGEIGPNLSLIADVGLLASLGLIPKKNRRNKKHKDVD
ncbi:LPXTG cell wall anchor domain-containing protein [Oenococcus oeni]